MKKQAFSLVRAELYLVLGGCALGALLDRIDKVG